MAAAPRTQDGRQNRLLDALPPEEYERLLPHLQPKDYPVKREVHAAGTPVLQVYFPCSGMLSQVIVLADGSVVEVAIVGKEGMVGLAALVSGWTDPSESFAQLPSQALQLDAAVFRDLAVAGSQLALLLQRYTQAYMIQVAQGAACNRAHTMEERCARWLLMTQDHALADHFKLTHEFLAYMLGTRRATVTLAAGMLQKAGLIQYRHGQVTVLDRPALETAACECYQTIREAQERVFIPEN